MILNNFKQVMRLALVAYGSKDKGGLPVKDPSGSTKYVCRLNSWPSNVWCGLTTSYNSNGIVVGSGSTPPSESDYSLESLISSGISAGYSIDTSNNSLDANGNPQLKIILTITNTGSSNVTIGELGFIQKVRLANDQAGSGSADKYILFDRSVLNTPVTIPAGESAAITYILKTVINT